MSSLSLDPPSLERIPEFPFTNDSTAELSSRRSMAELIESIQAALLANEERTTICSEDSTSLEGRIQRLEGLCYAAEIALEEGQPEGRFQQFIQHLLYILGLAAPPKLILAVLGLRALDDLNFLNEAYTEAIRRELLQRVETTNPHNFILDESSESEYE